KSRGNSFHFLRITSMKSAGGMPRNSPSVTGISRVTKRRFELLPMASSAASQDRKSTRLNSSHLVISYAVFCLKKKNKNISSFTTCWFFLIQSEPLASEHLLSLLFYFSHLSISLHFSTSNSSPLLSHACLFHHP